MFFDYHIRFLVYFWKLFQCAALWKLLIHLSYLIFGQTDSRSMFRSQRTPPVYDTGRKCIRTLFSRKDIHSQTENKRTHTLNFPLRWLPYIFNYDVECLFKIKKMSIEVHVSKQGYFNYAFNVQPGFIYLRNKIIQTSIYKIIN